MIKRVEISGVHFDLSEDVKKHALQKFSRLDRYMTRHARKSVHIDVKLSEQKAKDKNRYVCEAIVHLPGETLTAKEATINIFAAIDVVETKLKNQLRKYKEKAQDHKADRKGVLRRFRRMADEDFRARQD